MTRRRMLKTAALGAAATFAAPMINRGCFRLFAGAATVYSARAVTLVEKSIVIDMLNPFNLADVLGVNKKTWFSNPENFSVPDLERYKSSGITVFHIAVGTGGPEAYLDTLRFISGWNGFIAHQDEQMMRVDEPARLDTVKGSGKLGIIIGVQNSEHFRTLPDIDYFYSLGQRVSQLTYNSRNYIGNGSTERRDEGLSDFGVSVVERMNRIGMAVDVSHSGDQTTLDACEVSKRPVLITHSNCRALNPHPRCKTDEAIKKMASTGGVMGITGVRMFVTAKEPTTLDNVLDHYDHVAKLVGVEHLGVGSDIGLEGYDSLPAEAKAKLHASYKKSYGFRDRDDIERLDHPKRTFDLTEGLIRRGYSDPDIELILGGNFRRVLKEIWKPMAA